MDFDARVPIPFSVFPSSYLQSPHGSSQDLSDTATIEQDGPGPVDADPRTDVEDELVGEFYDQVAKLEAALQEIKTSTDQFFGGPRVWSSVRSDFRRINPEGFSRLNRWLRSSTDTLYTLEGHLWFSGVGCEFKEGSGSREYQEDTAEEDETPIPQANDLSKKLASMCSEGYTALTEEITRPPTINNDKAENPTPQLRLESLMEEFDRFNLWASNTGVEDGALYILVNHDLYKHTQKILEGILVDLIKLGEECVVDESSFIKRGSPSLDKMWPTPWLESAKRFLGTLPRKSDKVNEYFTSCAAATPNERVSTPTGSQNELRRNLEEEDYTSNASHGIQNHHSDGNPQEGLVEGELRDQTDMPASPNPRPVSRSSTGSFAFDIDQRPLVDYLLDNLKESNDTLFHFARDLEMAKASLGEGTHSQLYQAVRKIKAGQNLPKADGPAKPSGVPPNLPYYTNLQGPAPRPPAPTQIVGPGDKTMPTLRPPTLPKINIPQPLESNPPITRQRSKLRMGRSQPGHSKSYPTQQQRFTNFAEYPPHPEEVQDRKIPKPSQVSLWDRIHSAALTDAKSLPSLLSEFEDIGFGLYCDREGAVLDALGLDKWVALEILTCMWRNTSQHMKDSFRKNANESLSKLEIFGSEPRASNNPPYGQRRKPGTAPYTSHGPAAATGSSQPYRVSGRYTTTYYPETTDHGRDMPDAPYRAMGETRGYPSPERQDIGKRLLTSTPHNLQPAYAPAPAPPAQYQPTHSFLGPQSLNYPSYFTGSKSGDSGNYYVNPTNATSDMEPPRLRSSVFQTSAPPQPVPPGHEVGKDRSHLFIDVASRDKMQGPATYPDNRQPYETRNLSQQAEDSDYQTQRGERRSNRADRKGKGISPQRHGHEQPTEYHLSGPLPGEREYRRSEH